MTFSTGGGPEDPSRPLFGGEAGSGADVRGPAGGRPGGTSEEFTLSNPVGSFAGTAREVLLRPIPFFRGMDRRGGFGGPLVFAVICAAIAGILTGLVTAIVNLALGNQGVGGAVGSFFGSAILFPIGTVIGLFIGAGIYHLLVMLLIRPNSGFEATFRVLAYASALLLVSWLSPVPILGALVSLLVGLYSIFLYVVGIREAHGTNTIRAVLVVVIPTVVLLLIVLLFVAAIIATLFAAGQQGL